MLFKRVTTPPYPCVYDTWSTDSASWIIQDITPEHDDEAIKILVEDLCPDETLCSIQKVKEDPASVYHIEKFWRECLQQRVSHGCFEVKDERKKLVAVNICIALAADEDPGLEVKGEKWKNVYDVVTYIEHKVDPYKVMGLDMLLQTFGLVVKREYRGAKLGQRMLAAREPLCKSLGIQGTATVFTAIASQKLAALCGFQNLIDVPIRELAEQGLPYPVDDPRILKFMVKKYS